MIQVIVLRQFPDGDPVAASPGTALEPWFGWNQDHGSNPLHCRVSEPDKW